MTDELRMEFTDREGNADVVVGEHGTNFGIRISATEAARLLRVHGYALPFDIMAAGYGQDEDWCGLDKLDLDTDGHLKDPEGWAPYEVYTGSTEGVLRAVLIEDVDAAAERGYAMDASRLGVGDALTVVGRWVDGAGDVPLYVTSALERIAETINHANWGACAECGEDLSEHLWKGDDLSHTFTQSEA